MSRLESQFSSVSPRNVSLSVSRIWQSLIIPCQTALASTSAPSAKQSGSSSMMVKTAPATGRALPLVAVAERSILLSSEKTSLFTAAMVTVAVLPAPPGGMVRVVVDKMKSAAAAGLCGVADTAMVVVAVEVRFWVAVMVAAPPFSDMESVDRDRVTIGESSSTIVSAAPVTVGAGSVWAPLDILADMFSVLDDDVAVLLLAVMVTVPVLWVRHAGDD